MNDNPSHDPTDDIELDLSDPVADRAASAGEAELDDVEIDLTGDEATSSSDDVEIDLGVEPGDTSADDEGLDLDLSGGDEDEDRELTLEDLAGPADEDTDDDSEDDSLEAATEKAMEELRLELRSKPGDWYVVHTYSGMEKRVKQNLENRVVSLNMEDFIFEVRVPTEEVTEIRNGNKKTVTRTVLPGYVLVCMELTDESWAAVRHTPSVTGFVGHATAPVPLSLEEVEKMLAPSVQAAVNAEAGGKPKTPRKKKVEVADFNVGDSVMVTDGPFTGVHASITEINANSQRLRALVEILGRETPVDLTFSQVEKV